MATTVIDSNTSPAPIPTIRVSIALSRGPQLRLVTTGMSTLNFSWSEAFSQGISPASLAKNSMPYPPIQESLTSYVRDVLEDLLAAENEERNALNEYDAIAAANIDEGGRPVRQAYDITQWARARRMLALDVVGLGIPEIIAGPSAQYLLKVVEKVLAAEDEELVARGKCQTISDANTDTTTLKVLRAKEDYELAKSHRKCALWDAIRAVQPRVVSMKKKRTSEFTPSVTKDAVKHRIDTKEKCTDERSALVFGGILGRNIPSWLVQGYGSFLDFWLDLGGENGDCVAVVCLVQLFIVVQVAVLLIAMLRGHSLNYEW